MEDLVFPFAAPPAFGETLEVAPGILWLRLPLPFRLDHVNVYCLEDAEGWIIVDTGVDDARTRGIWCDVLAGPLGGRPVRRVLATHFHPDHVGAADFLCRRTGAPLAMGETEYLTARVHGLQADADSPRSQDFYKRHGLAAEPLAAMAKHLTRYRAGVPDLPRGFEPLREGDALRIGGRRFEVRCFAGHSPAQMLLHAPGHGILLAADHVMARISPNVSVTEERPDDDPLGLYLASFETIRAGMAEDTLVLPGHRLPFVGLHARMRQLSAHHRERCDAIVEACRARPLSVAEIVPLLFPMELDPHQVWFAFSEALAHVNHLARRGRLFLVEAGGIKSWSVGGLP